MRRSSPWFPLALATLLGTGVPGAGGLWAADAPPAAPPAGTATWKTLTDAEAAPLLDGLKKAAKAKKAEEAMPALEAIAGAVHHDFEPALAKLLAHPVAAVAVRAAREIGARPPEAKTGATLWKAWGLPQNDKRWDVRGAILRAMGAIKAPLDDRQYDEAKKLWLAAPSIEAMDAFTAYFAAVASDKRPCEMLARWLDEPRAGSVSDASNPPASWWEARWKLWQATKPGAVAALKAITGQSFETTAEAKRWFDANPKFGVKM